MRHYPSPSVSRQIKLNGILRNWFQRIIKPCIHFCDQIVLFSFRFVWIMHTKSHRVHLHQCFRCFSGFVWNMHTTFETTIYFA